MNNTTIDPKVLQAIGIQLSANDEADLLERLQKTLEERIGLTIIESLDAATASVLNKIADHGSQEELTQWLTLHVPDYGELVKIEYDILMGEVAQNADKF
jgi:hypothetical protein